MAATEPAPYELELQPLQPGALLASMRLGDKEGLNKEMVKV